MVNRRLWGGRALIFCIGLLLIVWWIPHAIAVRRLLLALGLLLGWRLARPQWQAEDWFAQRPWLLGFALFSLWLIFNSTVISDRPSESLAELQGQWLNQLLCLLLGWLVGLSSFARGRVAPVLRPAAWISLLVGLWSLLALANVISIHRTGQVALGTHKLQMTYLLNLLLAFLAVDGWSRLRRQTALTYFPAWLLLPLMLLSVYSNLLCGARNGMIGAVMLLLSLCGLLGVHWWQQGRKEGRLLMAAGIAVLGLMAAIAHNFRQDARWQMFSQTVPYAWDIDQHRFWLDRSQNHLPVLPSGETVDESAYERIAFIHAGLRFMTWAPLGVGYRRTAFVRAEERFYGIGNKHAHSGVIELGVGGGIPALLLWFGTMAILLVRGWQQGLKHHNPYGLALLFIVIGFCGRMVLENIFRDHMLEVFLFLLGLLLAFTRATHRH